MAGQSNINASKNVMKVDSGPRSSRPNPKRASNGLDGLGEIQALVHTTCHRIFIKTEELMTC